jgi:hypothetical protein
MALRAMIFPLWHTSLPLLPLLWLYLMYVFSVADTISLTIGVGVYCAVAFMITVHGVVSDLMRDCELL